MPIDTPVESLVRQLSRVGLRPDQRLVGQILAHEPEAARSALLSLATRVEDLHTQLPAALGPLHALRLLGELPDPSIIRPLLGLMPIDVYGEEDVPARLFASEIQQIVGRIGAPAVTALWELVDDETAGRVLRIAAASSLAYVATFTPETRAEILAEGRRRLADLEQPQASTTGIVTMLAELGDAVSYREVMAAYRAGRVDQSATPAAAARQLLLGGTGRTDLTCVSHPLWERYDHHGPFPRQSDDELLD